MRLVSTSDFVAKVYEFNKRAVSAWNAGDLETFISGYAHNATYLTKASGLVEGRDDILAAYQTEFPDRSKMGTIQVAVRRFNFPPYTYNGEVGMAVAIVQWATTQTDGTRDEGFSTVTFELGMDGEVRVVQDTSV